MTAERKDDAGKAPVLKGFLHYFPRAIKAVATVSQAGFEKYGAWGGWRGVPDGMSRYGDADVRHLLGEATEGSHDMRDDLGQPGTRCLHLALHAWNAMARLDKFLEENPDVPLRAPPEQEPVPIKEPPALLRPADVTWIDDPTDARNAGRILGRVPAGVTGQEALDSIARTISRRIYGGMFRPMPAFRPLPEKFEHACPDLDQEYPPCSCPKSYCEAEITGSETVYEGYNGAAPSGRVQCVRLRVRDDKRIDVV